MDPWPDALTNELANRRCIIFLGSGASAGSSSLGATASKPPTWVELLNEMKGHMRTAPDIAAATELIGMGKYLDAAEVIKNDIPVADFTTFMRSKFGGHFTPSPIHEAVLRIDPKIVITTNYDEIYDTYCRHGVSEGLVKVCKYYDTGLIEALRSPIRLIIKAHGCVTESTRTVLTRSEYFRARQHNAGFYKTLDALFLTNTLFFIGYRLTDPDIQLVLENVNIAAESGHPHYACIPSGMHTVIKKAMQTTYNIDFIEYPEHKFDEVYENLGLLADEVIGFRAANPA